MDDQGLVVPRPRAEALVRFAEQVGGEGPVAVAGGRSAWDVGGAPAHDVRLVRAPSGIVAFDPDELTVRVGAGTSTSELDAVLRASDQEVAMPTRPGGTVGGALCVGWSDVRRLRIGPVRDVLLEASIVTAAGHLVRAGGPTVKNVTGYDLCRVLVGSLGTLALIGEVVLRTRPRPASAQWVRVPDVGHPSEIAWRTPSTAAALWDGHDLVVLFEGHPDDVARHRDGLRRSSAEEVGGPPSLPPHRWSLEPAAAVAAVASMPGRALVELGIGTVHAETASPTRTPAPGVRSLNQRMKQIFDPTGRLNPGRDVMAR